MQAYNDETNVVFGTRNIFYRPMDKNIKILSQDFNGPCMLIAIVNALILKGEIILENSQYTLSSIVHILQKLNNKLPELDGLIYGYDINPFFTDCTKFKGYPDFLNLLNLKMVHSIVCDPILPMFQEISKYDYDTFQIQLCENENDEKDNLAVSKKKDFIKEWNEEVKKQTTKYGIQSIKKALQNNEIAIYFRANHYSVLLKFNNSVYCLLTDEGFNYTEYVWESIPDERGDSVFYDSNFNSLTEGSLENLIESVESLSFSKSQFSEANMTNDTEQKFKENDKSMKDMSYSGSSQEDLSKTNNLVDQQRNIEKMHEIEQSMNPQSNCIDHTFWENLEYTKPN